MANVLVVLGLLVSGVNCCKENVCLKKEIVNRTLFLYCRVYELGLSIEFHHPEGVVIGDCPAPVRDKNSKIVIRCNNNVNITQNLKSNITTLTIKDIDAYNVSGEWICTHGSYPDAITIPVYELQDVHSRKQDETGEIWYGLMILFLITTIGLLGVVVFLSQKIRKMLKSQTHLSGEKMHLLHDKELELSSNNERKLWEGTVIYCHTCSSLSTCAICAHCETLYCGVCCDAHLKYYKDHTICRTEHSFTSSVDVKCKKCVQRIATSVCMGCKKVLCKICVVDHIDDSSTLKQSKEQAKILRLNPDECDPQVIQYLESIQIEKKNKENIIKICGISFLSDWKIVVADSNNNKLTVFNENFEIQFVKILDSEPRGITHTTENIIAVTFGYEYEIRFFKIKEEVCENTSKMINLKTFELGNLKPFSICYSNGYLAVEAGEGDDGCILIVTCDGGKLLKRVCVDDKIVHFTGNTIRMALEMDANGHEGKIFISAMSAQSVLCLDLEGRTVWRDSLPSPRDIIIIPQQTMSDKNIIVASKACSVIFRLSKTNGTDESLIAKGKIIRPRYMAYHPNKKLLCVQVAKSNDENQGEQLLLYRYADIDIYSSVNE